jgi:uroporphyrinogen-III synthase
VNYTTDFKVLVTRPEKQAENLCYLLEQIGATPVKMPVLKIVAVESITKTREVLSELQRYQWLIFVSANAVNFALDANNGKIPNLLDIKVIAIGQATAGALKNAGIDVDLIPKQGFNSEAVLALPELQQIRGVHCLIIRGQGGRELLRQTLEKRGAQVDYLEVYQRILPKVDTQPVHQLLDRKKLDVITVTSVEVLNNLLKILGSKKRQLFSIPLVVISQRIGKMAAELGFQQIIISQQPTDSALVEAIQKGRRSVRSN